MAHKGLQLPAGLARPGRDLETRPSLLPIRSGHTYCPLCLIAVTYSERTVQGYFLLRLFTCDIT